MAAETRRKARTPAHLRAAGKRLWEQVTTEFDLDEHELALLREAARTCDVLDDLDDFVREEGAMVAGSHGGVKAHPVLVEARQQRIALARLVAVLRLPAGEEDTDAAVGRRQPRRVGARGVYGIKAVS